MVQLTICSFALGLSPNTLTVAVSQSCQHPSVCCWFRQLWGTKTQSGGDYFWSHVGQSQSLHTERGCEQSYAT